MAKADASPKLVPFPKVSTRARPKRRGYLPIAALGAAFTAISGSGCVGIDSGLDYPDVSDVDLEAYLQTPEGEPDPSVTLSEFKIAPATCKDVDMDMAIGPLDQEDLNRFFAARGLQIKAKKARDDLWWYEFPVSEDPADGALRLRLAVLKDREGASKDLHDALLQHGPGWWGVRRANLAILAPKEGLSDALRFAIKHRLVCWGMFTYAGVDDAYVVSGGYSEF